MKGESQNYLLPPSSELFEFSFSLEKLVKSDSHIILPILELLYGFLLFTPSFILGTLYTTTKRVRIRSTGPGIMYHIWLLSLILAIG